jgi:hypothetical protein
LLTKIEIVAKKFKSSARGAMGRGKNGSLTALLLKI